MTEPKEGPVGQGRGRKYTSQDNFACSSSIPPAKRTGPSNTSDAALRDAWIAETTIRLAREVYLVVLAADRLASGYRLSADDQDRLHQAHQFIFSCLNVLRDSGERK